MRPAGSAVATVERVEPVVEQPARASAPRLARPASTARRDGVALTADAFYTLNIETGLHGAPRLAHDAFNQDTEAARASVRKLAELRPSAAWPGHAEPLTGDVAAQLANL